MKILSLGWGVQSFTLAAMAALGEIERPDYAINADTGYESVLTYDFARRWSVWLEDRGVKVVTVKGDNSPVIANRGRGGRANTELPAFTESKNGPGGMLRRQCTQRWKVAPMRRWIQANRNGQPVEQWLGISTDEWQRMRDSDVKYITNRYPLIEMHMSRAGCIDWLQKHRLEVPPKSACYFCPFHRTSEWRAVKNTSDWPLVVAVDEQIRDARPSELGLKLYLHPSLKPIDEADFRSEQEKGQLSLWDAECSGICGI